MCKTSNTPLPETHETKNPVHFFLLELQLQIPSIKQLGKRIDKKEARVHYQTTTSAGLVSPRFQVTRKIVLHHQPLPLGYKYKTSGSLTGLPNILKTPKKLCYC